MPTPSRTWPDSVLEFWGLHQKKIDLLFTNVVTPEGINGIELGRILLKDKSSLKVFLSEATVQMWMKRARSNRRAYILSANLTAAGNWPKLSANPWFNPLGQALDFQLVALYQ